MEDIGNRVAFARELHDAGVKVQAIMVYGESTIDLKTASDDAMFYRGEFGDSIDFLCVGNEPDLDQTWQDPEEYLAFLYRVLAGWGPRGDTEIWGPGLASGGTSWLDPIRDELLRIVERLPIHPYGRGPDGVLPGPFGLLEDLVASYRWYIEGCAFRPSPEVMANEWGIAARDAEDDHERAAYVSAMILKFQELGVDSCLFCLGPMVPEYDLRGPDGEPNELYAAFVGSFA
jgi:hypothetical protein